MPEQLHHCESEENDTKEFSYGIKLPREYFSNDNIDKEKFAAEIQSFVEQGITTIEIPHNISKNQLDEIEASFWIELKRSYPQLRLSIHENTDKVWPYDHKEYDKDFNFEPKTASLWARELGKMDIEQVIKSACDAIDKAKMIGAEVVTIHPIGAMHGYAPKEFIEYDKIYFQAIGKYLEAINEGEKEPVKVAIENFAFRYGKEPVPGLREGEPEWQVGQATDFRTPNELSGQIDVALQIDSPHIGYTLDIGHAYWSESGNVEKILEAIERLGKEKLFHVHIHDTVRAADRHLKPSSGEIDFKPILEKLHEIGFEGILEVEVPQLEDAISGIETLKIIDKA